ncbi:hypothetical protein AU210_016250 [Fusarium oxysporum f. sp. radicis-cucumerinum]|uniref:Uncharacterized protein n=1 Tax=Fusarium oxysporum f. sp. radicis-cucumerinum TaxID=327505 RepID=A0A2H3G292_FUSOX|nr:hypothetical protein AU210_016250 [Fusarium oxysporum f. sp. radicis-cucumerinum]
MLDSESSTDCGSKATPSTITGVGTVSLDDRHAADPDIWSRPAIQSPDVTPSLPDPTVLLSEIQVAADDVEELVGRFGPKMANKLISPTMKVALFPDRNKLKLSSLGYADNFTCRRTSSVGQKCCFSEDGCFSKNGFPLLWWLWDPLIELFINTKGCTLDFASARRTDVDMPYTIKLRLWSDQGTKKIELTAAYGDSYNKRTILDAPIATFKFPRKSFQKATLPLSVDQVPYNAGYEAMFKYLMPRERSIWYSAMSVSQEHEETLVKGLAESRKSNSDRFVISEGQGLQWKNLMDRLPKEAREFVENGMLV